MSEIHIERPHNLGLPRARGVATQWMAQARERWGLQFEHEPAAAAATTSADGQEPEDRIRFGGMGAEGTVQVGAARFVVHLSLGGLMAALAPMVEEKMTRKLDALLAQEAAARG